MQNNNA